MKDLLEAVRELEVAEEDCMIQLTDTDPFVSYEAARAKLDQKRCAFAAALLEIIMR